MARIENKIIMPYALVACVAATSCSLGFVLSQDRTVDGSFFSVLIASIILGIVFYFALYYGFRAWDNHTPHEKRTAKIQWVPFAVIFILLCWVPVFLAGYPGFFSYDAGLIWLGQWTQIEEGILNAHHPVLHTLFLKYTIYFGWHMFGSFNAGVAFSVWIQALFLAGFFGFVLAVLVKVSIGRIGFVLSACFFALHPLISMFAFCATKDVACTAFFVTLVILLGIVAKGGKPTKLLLAGVGMSAFFAASLRSNILLVVVAAVPLCFFLMPKESRKILCTTLSMALIGVFLWLVPVASLLNIEPSPIGVWNAAGVPMQQLARCTLDQTVSNTDREELAKKIVNPNYREDFSDTLRRPFFEWKDKSPKSEIVETYLRYGLKYPLVYTDAFLLHTEPAWSPFGVIDCYWPKSETERTSVFSFKLQDPAVADTKFPTLYGLLEWISSYRGIESIPVVGAFFSIAFYLGVLLLAFVRSFVMHNRFGLVVTLFLSIASLGCLFGPCMLFRYFLYNVFALPLLVFLIFQKPNTSIEVNANNVKQGA